MKSLVRTGLMLGALATFAAFAPALARADVQHTVARGHTILSIAHRYHVSVKSILDANHLKDATHLKVGSTLTIPGATATAPGGSKAKLDKEGHKGQPLVVNYHQRAKTPGVVHATRLATNEDFSVRVMHRGHASPTSIKTFERMMRNGAGLTHPIDPRLVQLVSTVSDHFGSRRLEVISGFRPYVSTQYTKHSNHNIGHAIDFRVVGVPNEVLRDYCRTLHNVGVGYYPNSTFVHLDVRTSPAFWIDYSHPGEAPRYNSPNADADEGTSDVSDDGHAPESAIIPDAPAAPPLPAASALPMLPTHEDPQAPSGGPLSTLGVPPTASSGTPASLAAVAAAPSPASPAPVSPPAQGATSPSAAAAPAQTPATTPPKP